MKLTNQIIVVILAVLLADAILILFELANRIIYSVLMRFLLAHII